MSTAINLLEQESDSESRKVLWAILASIFIHLVVAFSLATFGNRFSSIPQVEDKPVELTLIDVAPVPAPAVPANPPFMATDESKKTDETPKEKTFESNANSIAASEVPANGESALPTQEGKDRPLVDLETHESALSLEGAQPQPTPAPTAAEPPKTIATPPPTPPPVATPAPDQFAMLTATPPPAIEAPEEEALAAPAPEAALPARPKPAQPESAYRPYKEQTRISGRITNRGASAVDAVGTPFGRYQKSIYDSIGSRWLYYTKKQGSLINIGTAHVTFMIDREGRVENLKMTGNTSNEAFANVCLESIQQAKLPPAPPEVADVLPPEGLIMDLTFTVFAN
jgi:outer membrane biosynthesis protein TonB